MAKANATFIFILAANFFLGASATLNGKNPGSKGSVHDNIFSKVKTTTRIFEEKGYGPLGADTMAFLKEAAQGLAAGNKLHVTKGRIEAIHNVGVQELGRRGFTTTESNTSTETQSVLKNGKRYTKTVVRNARGEVIRVSEEVSTVSGDATPKNNPNDYTRKPIFEEMKKVELPKELADLIDEKYGNPLPDPKRDVNRKENTGAKTGATPNGHKTPQKDTPEYKPVLYTPTDNKAGGGLADVALNPGNKKPTGEMPKETYGRNYYATPTPLYKPNEPAKKNEPVVDPKRGNPETSNNNPYGKPLGTDAKREQALREQALREQALREQALREQALREQAKREQAKKEEPKRGSPAGTYTNPTQQVPSYTGTTDALKKDEFRGQTDNGNKPKANIPPQKEEFKVPPANMPNTAEVLSNQGQGTKQPPTRPTGATKKPPTLPEREKKTNISPALYPAGFHTRVRNLKDGYLPLNVAFELGPVINFLQHNGMLDLLPLLKKLLHKAAAILRMYIHVPENVQRVVRLRAEHDYCGDFYLTESQNYNAHLVMLSRIFVPGAEDRDTIASSKYCEKDGEDRNRAIVGSLNLSSDKLPSDRSTPMEKWSYVMTVVHEILHTLAFHSNSDRVLKQKNVSPDLPLLTLIKAKDPKIYDDGHWIEGVIVNDIMGPISRPGNIWSAPTNEIIAHTSPDFSPNNKDLVHNHFLESVSNLSEFFAFQCKDAAPSPYPYLCSQVDKDKRRHSCSADYVFMSRCGEEKKFKNCYKSSPLSDGNCMEARPGKKGSVFEYRGTNARCFEVNNVNGAMCLQYEVQGRNVVVILGTTKAICTPQDAGVTKTETVELSRVRVENGYMVTTDSITFTCPDTEKFIKAERYTRCPDDCNHNGFCSKGKCICLDGYDSGDNCKKDTEVALNNNMFSEYLNIQLKEEIPK